MERYKFNIIKDEIQFENFTRDFVKLIFPGVNFQLYGKKGQAQSGIDGYSTSDDVYFQSKHKSKDSLKDQFIINELNQEFNKAKLKIQELSPAKKSKYLFFSTHAQSTIIQDEAKKISTDMITVEYWGWEAIESILNDLYKHENIGFFSKYYPEIAKSLNINVIPKQLSIKSVNDIEWFIGRTEELTGVEKQLNEKKILLINGIGGIGKSSVASYILFKNKEKYDYYGFFEGISNFISDLNQTLSLKSETENDLLRELIINLRSIKGSKLLIIDNIDSIDECTDIINALISLKEYGFSILLTSRETTDKIDYFELGSMNTSDAKKLFNSIYKVEDPLLEELLSYIDNHTFFIEKVAKTLKSKDTLTPEKIKEYFENGQFSKIKTNRKESFEKVLNELFSIDNLDVEESLILKQISLFPSEFISFGDLRLVLQKENKEDFEDLLNYLSEKGWLIKHYNGFQNGYKLHQIIKEYLFSAHKPSFDDLKTPIAFYNAILSESANIEVGLYHKDRLIYFDSLYKTLRILNIQRGEIFLLLKKIGNVYFHLGKIKQSLEILHTALEISNKIANLHKMYITGVYTTLGEIYRRVGDSNNALSYAEKSALICEKYLDNDSIELAGQYSNLGHQYKTFGQVDKSFEYFTKALRIVEIHNDSSTKSFVYKGIAEAYQIKQDYKKALEFFEKALDLRKRLFDDQHPLIAQSYNDLGFIYACMGQKYKSIPFYIEAMKRYEKCFGDNHIDTANIYNNLGEAYRYTEQYSKAYPLIRKAMEIREREQGIDVLDTAMSYNTMGVYYAGIGEYPKSIEYLTKSLHIINSTLGSEHDYFIQTLSNLEYTNGLMSDQSDSNLKVSRNDLCPCGSGKKYKKCCLGKD